MINNKNICIFFHDYKIFHETKDPGQIMLGLSEKKTKVTLITLKKEELNNYKSPFPLIEVTSLSKKNLEKVIKSFDIVIIYSWLNPKFNYIFEIAKSLNKKIILKSDSNGRLGIIKEPKKTLNSRLCSYKSLFVFIKRFFIPYFEKKDVQKKIYQMTLSDYVIVESPDAVQNISYFLSKNKNSDLIKKIIMIPNPVTIDVDLSNKKENFIISIGRWDDKGPKNPKGLVKSLSEFLLFKKHWKALVIGPGEDIIKKYIKNLPNSVKERIIVTGSVEHEKIKDYLLKSKIFFMPSRWESFGIAAAEALCCGCTVVGSPIESLRYLTMQGFSGNVSYSLDPKALTGTLVYESNRWENNKIDYLKMSNFWRQKLNRQSIAQEFLNIVDRIGSEV